MADLTNTPPPTTPVAPVVLPPNPDGPTTATPVTSQPAPATAPSQPGQPTLEAVHQAETFAALGKLFDESTPAPPPTTEPTVAPQSTPESPGATKPTETPPEKTPLGATDDFDKKLEGIKAPPGAHPNVAAGIDQIKKEAKDQYTRAEGLATQLKEVQTKATQLETQIKEAKLPEPVEKELNELRAFRREIDYRNDPEFVKQYLKPVQQADSEIMGLLKQSGLKQEHLDWITKHGGIIALSQSGESAGIKDKPDTTMAEWVEGFLLAKTPGVFKTRIMGKLSSALDTIEKGRNELADFQENSQSRYEAKMQKLTQEFEAGRDTAIQQLGDIAKPKQIPANATAEERVSIEAHNTRLKEAGTKFDNYLKVSKDPKIAGEILVKATQADMLLTLYNSAQETIKALEAKVAGIKAAGATSEAGSHTVTSGPEKPSMGDLLKTTTEAAMGKLFSNQGQTP